MIRFFPASKITLSCVAGVAICTTPYMQLIDHFQIESWAHDFLFGTTTTWSFTFSNSHFFSGQSQHASSPSIVLYLWLGTRRPTATVPVVSPGTTRGWPLRLLRGNSAYENLQQETQWPKRCLYETPYYIAAPVRETGDAIVHLQEPDFFWFTSNAFLQRPVLL